jgi:hypothetical protein
MNQAAVKQYLKTVPIKDLDVLEQIIAARREKAEVDAILDQRIADIDSGKVKLISAEEFIVRTDEHIRQRVKSQKCLAVK